MISVRNVGLVLGFAAALLAAPAQADDNSDQPLSAWLAGCSANRQACISNLTYGYETAAEMAEVCPPQGLDESTAAETELRWLQNAAASNPTLAAGKELDAEWTALHTLWPCSN